MPMIEVRRPLPQGFNKNIKKGGDANRGFAVDSSLKPINVKNGGGEMKARMFFCFVALVLVGVVALPAFSQTPFVKTLGGTSHDYGWSVVEVSEGVLVVTGGTRSYGAGHNDFILAKLDGSGKLLLTRTLGGTGFDEGYSVVEVSDGGLVVTGRTESYGAGSGDLLLAKFDGSGNLLWTRTLGGASEDYGWSVVEVSDGGLVVTGLTAGYGAGSWDLLLAKFDGSGNTCMGEFITPDTTSFDPTITSPDPTITSPEPDTASWNPTVTSHTPPITLVCEVAPRISSITDVGNDQGKQVRIKWHRCYWDTLGSPYTITEYSIWRRIDLYKTSRSDAEILPTEGGSPYERMTYPPGEWDFIKTVPARGELTYSTICPTLADSTIADGMYWSVFFVSAMTADPLVYFDSDPDSGYSVDNLPPAPPKDLIVASSGDPVVNLFWKPNSERDLWYYAVYRDTVSEFEPDSSNLLGNTADTTYNDTVENDRTYYYKVTAFDVSGNESDPSNEGVYVGVNEAESSILIPKAFTLSQNYPNPFNPQTTIRYALPEDAQVSLVVYNVTGQKIKTLVDEEQEAGYHECVWDGKDVASGIYFYRLDAGGFVETRKMILLK